jgi:hypothetical protein
MGHCAGHDQKASPNLITFIPVYETMTLSPPRRHIFLQDRCLLTKHVSPWQKLPTESRCHDACILIFKVNSTYTPGQISYHPLASVPETTPPLLTDTLISKRYGDWSARLICIKGKLIVLVCSMTAQANSQITARPRSAVWNTACPAPSLGQWGPAKLRTWLVAALLTNQVPDYLP